eukprot:gb/GECG01003101.1/.p1 GENE.gb/GECG01003101.1/~~gb/GECG01003101.1/.p1  ORF type:complete len:382 (+),score=56.12 gb/GECG01003101.1/:1-1146(+)
MAEDSATGGASSSHSTQGSRRKQGYAEQHSQGNVEGTSDDAAVSKLSAVKLGYIDDPFLHYFVKKHKRRSPLINRGYFARMIALETIATDFVNLNRRGCQIVSLGAGQDTLFFRLAKENLCPTKFFEIDLPSVTHLKTQVLEGNTSLRQMILSDDPYQTYDEVFRKSEVPNEAAGDFRPRGSRYALITADLADLEDLKSKLCEEAIDFSLPTLFISECVLVYMDPRQSTQLINWAGNAFPSGAFVTYEQIHPDDAFGHIMQQNLSSRGASLKGLHAYPTLTAQAARYTDNGWSYASVADMNDIYYKYIPQEKLKDAEQLEIFDEFEEWHLMMGHYCIAVAINDQSNRLGEPDEHGEVRIPPESLLRLLWSKHIYYPDDTAK